MLANWIEISQRPGFSVSSWLAVSDWVISGAGSQVLPTAGAVGRTVASPARAGREARAGSAQSTLLPGKRGSSRVRRAPGSPWPAAPPMSGVGPVRSQRMKSPLAQRGGTRAAPRC